jgi:2'-5' RNA ligase
MKASKILLRSFRTANLINLEIYEKLWNDAVSAFARGEPKLDPHLPNKTNDARRGVTLLFRPPADVREAIADFIGRLAKICPGQYLYQPQELHVTVLSIITMTDLWRQEMERFHRCRPIIIDALPALRAFGIKFCGVTASPDSVLIQGFPTDDGLETIRAELRNAFARSGFADMLDRRYKVTAAHITAMRFCRPGPEMERLLVFLKENRQTNFGECGIGKLELILGDWYASSDKIEIVEECRLY